MRRSKTLLGIAVTSVLLACGASNARSQTIEAQAVVKLIRDVEIPALAPGKLEEFHVREGEMVEEGQEIAALDTVDAELHYKAARYEHAVAVKEAENDIRVRAAAAAADVRGAEVDEAKAANDLIKNSVTKTEIRKMQLDFKHAQLQTEQAKMQFDVAGLGEHVQKSKLETAIHEIRKRRLKSPLNGMVVRYAAQVGEWLNTGEPVMRIIQMDKLYVTAQLRADEVAQHEIQDRSVEIEVKFANGRVETFQSTIAYFTPEVEADGRYFVRAEIENRKENNHWLVYPGLDARVRISK